MNSRSTTCARVVATAAVLTAAVTLFASTCAAAELDRRPCRATSRRLYEELQGSEDEYDGGGGGDGDGNEEPEIVAEGGDREPPDDREPAQDDYYSPPPPPPPPPPVYDKPRRGVRRLTLSAQQKQHEKTSYERSPYTAAAAAPAGGNGLRASDTALLRGETIELPTYVNVPVTLRCRFVPLDGTDNKFETVVESMYPGHADAPPPPTDSHASQIIRQLMGSVDGWRSVINKSTRPVRRVIETRFGWPPTWSMNGGGGGIGEDDRRLREESRSEDRYDGGRGRRGWQPYAAEDAAGRQIAARRLAAEQQQWFRGSRPNARLDARRRFSERRPIVRGHQDSAERQNDRPAENELIEDRQRDERIDDRQQSADRDDVGSSERAEYSPPEPVDGGGTEEPVDGQRAEQLDGQTADDRTADAMAAEETVDEQRTEDRAAEESVDDGRVLGEVSDDEFQLPAATTESEIASTTTESDYLSFTPDSWIKISTEDVTPAPHQ